MLALYKHAFAHMWRYTAAMKNQKRTEMHRAIDQLTDTQLEQLATLIERLLAVKAESPTQPLAGTSRQEAFQAMLDRLAKAPQHAPELRNSTFPREMIYGEHD